MGDWVYLKLRPYRQKSVAKRRNDKLPQCYFGLYQIISRLGRLAYKLQLPYHSQIHPMFRISQLKKAVPATYTPQELPAILTRSLEWATKPEKLLDIRKSISGQGAEVLVQWSGLPLIEATWESLAELVNQFPAFNLEDKVSLLWGSIERLRIAMAFMRKKMRTKGRKGRAMEMVQMKSG